MPSPPFSQPGFIAPPPNLGIRPNPNLEQQVQQGAIAKEAKAALQSMKPKPKPRNKGARLKIDSEKQFPSLGASPTDNARTEGPSQTTPKPKPKEEKSQATAQFLRPSQIVFKSKKKTSTK